MLADIVEHADTTEQLYPGFQEPRPLISFPEGIGGGLSGAVLIGISVYVMWGPQAGIEVAVGSLEESWRVG